MGESILAPPEPTVPVQDPTIGEPGKRRRVCHTVERPGRAICGARLSGGRGIHSTAECRAAGHAHCEVCDLLGMTEGDPRGEYGERG